MFSSILYTVVFVSLIAASIFDLKTREVPDWLNYFLIIFGMGSRLIYSIIIWNFWEFLYGILGLALFIVLAYLMFYAGQWGGGDSKMIIGLGAVIGFDLKFDSFLFSFFVNLLFSGALYGLLWVFGLLLIKFRLFLHEFKKMNKRRTVIKAKIIVVSIVLALMVLQFFLNTYLKMFLFALILIMITGLYLSIIIKAVETSIMIKSYLPEQITEGDWICENVYDGKKLVCGPKDLGIEQDQIKKLILMKRKGKIKTVKVKEGIPFIPSFLIAFVITYLYGNVFLLLIL